MKSNEEFIAGIYEKAAVYTEEKETNSIKTVWAAKAARIAAMAAVCLGLTGIGSLVLGNGNNTVPGRAPVPSTEDYGIALTSETGDAAWTGEDEMIGSTALLRVGPVLETVTFNGVVTSIDRTENRIWLALILDETVPDTTVGSMVCIKWDILEPISEEISIGTTLSATGALSMYVNEASEQNGCAELVLTDLANFEIK